MNKKDLKETANKIISDHRTGILSSVENNKPHSRYMTFYNDNLTLFSPTKLNTEKVEEIEKNPSVSVLLGYEDQGLNDTYVQISGTSTVNDSQQLKEKYWDDSYKNWFSGPEDPNYVLLQIQPETVRILNTSGESPEEFSL